MADDNFTQWLMAEKEREERENDRQFFLEMHPIRVRTKKNEGEILESGASQVKDRVRANERDPVRTVSISLPARLCPSFEKALHNVRRRAKDSGSTL